MRSHICGFPSSKSCFIRKMASPGLYSPFFIFSNSAKDSAIGRVRCTHALRGPLSSPPRFALISSANIRTQDNVSKSMIGVYSTRPDRTCAMTYVRSISLDELDRQIVQFLEIVARVCDLVRFVPKPSHSLQNTLEINRLLGLGIRIIITEITLSVMMRRIPEINKDSLGVADMQKSVRFRREPRKDLAACGSQVLFAQSWVDLRVLSRFVQRLQEPFLENDSFRRGPRPRGLL